MKSVIFNICVTLIQVFLVVCTPARAFDCTQEFLSANHSVVLDEGGECYLVCIYKADVRPIGVNVLREQGHRELMLKAAIVDVIKGGKSRGEILEFHRHAGLEPAALEAANGILGKLFFVFRIRLSDGTFLVDAQDPSSVIPYSKTNEDEIRKFITK